RRQRRNLRHGQVPRQEVQPRDRHQGQVRRRRGHGRGQARDHGVRLLPQDPRRLPETRRQDPARRHPLRASRHRQNPSGESYGRRVRRPLLLRLRLRVRRDVRRCRRLPRPRFVREREEEHAMYHLHRRDRRHRQSALQAIFRWRERRAGGDAQPDPDRDGR
ncbi:hypothetical protein LTR53_019304, partial [Teratosphaeriaceae sp. CCFEE 6253]